MDNIQRSFDEWGNMWVCCITNNNYNNHADEMPKTAKRKAQCLEKLKSKLDKLPSAKVTMVRDGDSPT
jgi:hypothetical protein